MLLKILVLPASSSWLVDGPTRLGEPPKGFFRLGGRVLQGGAVLGEGRNFRLLIALPRERAAQRAEHEILLVFQSCDTRIILALVGAQLVEVFARRAQRILPGLGRHICAAHGTERLERELCGQLFKLGTRTKRLLGSDLVGKLGTPLCVKRQLLRLSAVTKQIVCRAEGSVFTPALPDLLELLAQR